MLKSTLRNFTHSILIVCLTIFSNGCSSKKVYLEDISRPLNTLHLAVKYALKGNIKKISPNSRIYFSPYHSPGMDLNALPFDKEERARVMISIHGTRRPYRISVAYIVEKYRKGKYRFDHYNKKRAKKYMEKIEEYLASRPEQRDVIDDFTPY